jgi:tRNA (cytidine/uridine-2'-O-)-methyltransferase
VSAELHARPRVRYDAPVIQSDAKRRSTSSDAAETANLSTHRLSVALVHPQIAPNTGNIARLCVATGTRLHLVRPMGFVLGDKQIKRSAMDYWPRLALTMHDDAAEFLKATEGVRRWAFSSKGERSFWDADFQDGDMLVFGSETAGLPSAVTDACGGHACGDQACGDQACGDRVVRIPQVPGERCLNLSTAAGIGLFEALRQIQKSPPRQGMVHHTPGAKPPW